MKIDVNSDMGEGFGIYQLCDDAALMKVVSSANIACGFHAGDPAIMTNMVRPLARIPACRIARVLAAVNCRLAPKRFVSRWPINSAR